jgi:hypothetical protein
MFNSKEKEPLYTVMGLTVHRPDIKEARIFAAIILLICTVLAFKTASFGAWALIAAVSIGCATFDLIPPEKPLRTLCVGLVAGAIIAFIATLK